MKNTFTSLLHFCTALLDRSPSQTDAGYQGSCIPIGYTLNKTDTPELQTTANA